MSSCASFISLFLFSFLISFRASAQSPNFLHRQCPNTTTYSRNSTYFTNLRTLLSSLSSRNASYSTGFQNATVGQAPDKVTGLFLCRGDLSPEVCRECVAFSVNETLVRCPNERQVVLFYDECMLRYSDQNILSTVTSNRGWYLLNANNISSNQEERYVDAVVATMNEAAIEAASSSRKFATIKTNWTARQRLYVLVQCTPDLSRQGCMRCLQRSIYGIPHNKVGGRFLLPSCSSRYEHNAFYNETAVTTPPPSPPSTSPVSFPPRPEIQANDAGKGGNLNVIAVAIVVPIIVAVLLFIACYCFFAKRKKKTSDTAPAFDGDDITTIESLQLDHRTIQAATNNYSENNKIGQGGFGVVYKGTFSNGTEVAVKRLSESSGQGDTEFKNEVVVVAKLQHRNLVWLLGFSLEREERILVYEYVPNKSLDYFIFDPTKKDQLNWTLRYNIIGGIARGILYLHQDSRLTIIHRDLKASNVLLDANMNPKISDFGLATIFGVDQTRGNTNRIAGTYAYMSPEYALHGQYSMKSDIYSFRVLVLEIISGKKNSGVYQMDETSTAGNLVIYAWRLWRNGSPLELVDPAIGRNYQSNEVTRCIHIALLCIQEDPEDRPMLSTIILMLGSNTSTLPLPRLPGFFPRSRHELDHASEGLESTQSTARSVPCSVNDVSITELEPR